MKEDLHEDIVDCEKFSVFQKIWNFENLEIWNFNMKNWTEEIWNFEIDSKKLENLKKIWIWKKFLAEFFLFQKVEIWNWFEKIKIWKKLKNLKIRKNEKLDKN